MKPTRHLAVVALAAALAAVLVLPARAQGPVVVELFTSQGCSSCPPADALMAELAADPAVLALALHVDYWDYIGWKDSFAQPAFTDRQKAYARAAGSKMIYTPQMIVNGIDRVEGTDPERVRSLVSAHQAADTGVTLTATRQGGVLVIEAASRTPLPDGADIVLVRFTPVQTVAILDGENAGHTLTYHNIVRSWQSVGTWSGQAPLRVEVPLAGPEEAAVLVQEPGPKAILAAARVD